MQAVEFSLVFSFVVAFFEVAESSSVVELAEMVYAPVASLCEMSFLHVQYKPKNPQLIS